MSDHEMIRDMIERAAAEMRRQCGKRTDAPWEEVSTVAKERWRARAVAVLEAMKLDHGLWRSKKSEMEERL